MSDRKHREMQGTTMTSEVRDNSAERRFELDVDGHIAFVNYLIVPGKIVLVHTEVPRELNGRGIGSTLAKATLEAVRAKGLKAVIRCDFLDGFVKKHPEYSDLVAAR